MNYTTNYNLKKPAGSDAINVGDFNDNADTIDTTLKSVSDTANGKYSKPSGGIPESDLSFQVSLRFKTVVTCECSGSISGQSLTNWEINQVSVTYAELLDALATSCAQGKNNVGLVVNQTAGGASSSKVFHINWVSLSSLTNIFSFTSQITAGVTDSFLVERLTFTSGGSYPTYETYQSTRTVNSSSTDSAYPTAKAVYDFANAKYTKPASGIPETDLASAVQTKLNAVAINVITADCDAEYLESGTDLENWKLNGETKSYAEIKTTAKSLFTAEKNIIIIVHRLRQAGSFYDNYDVYQCAGYMNAGNCTLSFINVRNASQYIEFNGIEFFDNENAPRVYSQCTQTEINSSSTNNDIPTAKAVYDFITGSYSTTAQMNTAIATAIADKQNVPSQITSGESITLADNTEYRLTDVTTLTIAYPSGNFECWMRISTASSGTITITLPSSQYIGDTPTFGNSEIWELSIKDGIVIASKVGA